VYYSTHQLFLSPRSTYIVVFNAENVMTPKAAHHIDYWLQSIKSRVRSC